MKLVFYANYLNIHQAPVMDEFQQLLGDDFRFVATLSRNEKELKGGADYSARSYSILAAESEEAHEEALRLAWEADTCVFGACSQEYAVERAVKNPLGLSFEMGERWFKRGWLTIGSSVFRQWLMNYYRYYRKANYHKLCCSAFAAGDDERVFAYKGRHYKWGYFTKVDYTENVHAVISANIKQISILWCGRFLNWKHPELAVRLMRMLKDNGYDAQLDMFGTGVEESNVVSLCNQLGVNDRVTLHGNVPNDIIRKAMRNHDIFIFTSDRQEGWGAVLNEAMDSGCAVVASDAMGSAPFLIKDGQNGFLFKSENHKSLYQKVAYLIDNPKERKRMAEQARNDMATIWSPKVAAQNLLTLINDINNKRIPTIQEGPCSNA